MNESNVEVMDSQILIIKRDLDDYFGEELFSRMHSFLRAGRINVYSTVDKLIQSLFDRKRFLQHGWCRSLSLDRLRLSILYEHT